MTAYDDIRTATAAAETQHVSVVSAHNAMAAQLAAVTAEYEAYKKAHPATTPTPEPTPTPDPDPGPGGKVIGMSSPNDQWTVRLNEVGKNGIRARRIFADIARGANDRISVVEDALDAGMIPVLSYKVGGNITGALAGQYDATIKAAATKLQSYDATIAVSFWHEPNPDITGAQFCALHRRYLPLMQGANVRVGPIWNGWLLDNQRSTFEQYLDDDLLARWDFAGMDVYQAGTETAPKHPYPGERVAPLIDVLTDHGQPDIPLVIGEYNGWTADAIAQSGETFLDTPTLWMALMFNSDVGNKGRVLTGDRLAAFKATKADDRVVQ